MTVLGSTTDRLTIGRAEGCDLHLGWDHEVSRLHAQLEHIGTDWVLGDDGLSRNGTYVNGERLTGRHRLRDGDVVLVGGTTIAYRANRTSPSLDTEIAQNTVTISSLSPTQRQVITALCRPYMSGSPYATPATNQQIADESTSASTASRITCAHYSGNSASRICLRIRSGHGWSNWPFDRVWSPSGTSRFHRLTAAQCRLHGMAEAAGFGT